MEAEAAAKRERERLEAEAAAKRERERLEAEARAAEEAQLAAEAAERERLEVAEAAARARQRAQQVEAEIEYEVDLDSDRFADFRPEVEERRQSLLQLMPLTVWAKVEPRRPSTDSEAPGDDLHGLMAGLALPPNVAAITYGGGCRIRRVRVPPASAPRAKGARGSRPVILSKRALDEVREENRTGR